MSKCKPFDDDFVEALYGDLEPSRRQAFDEHLKTCARCADQFASLRLTLDVMDEREISEPEPEFWEEFSARVRSLAAAGDENRAANVVRARPWPVEAPPIPQRSFPYWASRVAAGIAILILGVTIGRFSAPPGEVIVATTETPPSALNQRVSQYMEQSRTLLLGIVNLDPAADGFEALDLAPYQQVSHQLVEKAPRLKRDLNGAGEKRLARLVLELEEILLQIATLETTGAVEGVQTVRDGVEQRALLFKIHLESTRHPSPPPDKEKTQQSGARRQL